MSNTPRKSGCREGRGFGRAVRCAERELDLPVSRQIREPVVERACPTTTSFTQEENK